MVKLLDDPISKKDIAEFLEKKSDFQFEISVLKELNTLKYQCQHGGIYDDPITGKAREFDIRANKTLIKTDSFQVNLALSVECKNLKAHHPLLVYCLPREKGESYIDAVLSSHNSSAMVYAAPMVIDYLDGPYHMLDPIGKSCDQIGRKQYDNELTGNDGGVFEKISQAMNSAVDLIKNAHFSYKNQPNFMTLTFVIPVLVVPKQRIWNILYDWSGEKEEGPELVKNVAYFMGKSWGVEDYLNLNHQQTDYRLSHLEILEIGAITSIEEKILSSHLFETQDSCYQATRNTLPIAFR